MNPLYNNFLSPNMNNGYNNYFNNNNGYGYNMSANSNGFNFQNNNNFNNNGMISYNINSNNLNNGYLNNQNNFYQQNNYNNGNFNNQSNYNQSFNMNNYNNINNQNNYNQQIKSVNYINNNNLNQNNFNYNGQNFFNSNSNANRIQNANYFYENNNSNNNINNYNSFNQQSKNKNNQTQNRARNQNQGFSNINNQRNQNQYNNNYNPKQNIDMNQDIGNIQNNKKIVNPVYKNRGNGLNTNLSNQNNNKNKIYNNRNLINNQNNPGPNNANNASNKNQNNYNNMKNSLKINNKQNLNPKTEYPTKVKNKTKITLDFLTRATGLDNVGATCYMNATLQCFYHVKELSENIINDDTIKDKLKLTFCYKNLIEELAGCKEKKKYLLRRQEYSEDKYMKDSVKPIKFKNIISEMNPIFKGVQANDSKDLILFLLETMDKELTLRNNKAKEMEIFYGNSEDELKPENFKKCHNSILADIFYGFYKSVVKCEKCGTENPTFNVMNFLIFHLEKTYNELNQQKNNNNNMNNNMNNMNTQYNINNQYNMNNPYLMNNQFNMYNNMNNQYNMNNMYNNMNSNMNNYLNNHSNNYNNFRSGINKNQLNPLTFQPKRQSKIKNMNNIQIEKKRLTLDDCFKNNRNVENLTGENQIYCNKCRCNTNAVMYDEIHKAPNVLIIILNRGKGNIFECDLEFKHEINLSKYITNPASPKSYKLIGVISHLGQSSLEGHFIAYCKHFDDCWYIFNDSLVKQVDETKDFKGIPYILFYKNTQWKE